MKHALALLLLMGAMFGLLGEQTAAAAASTPAAASAPASALDADCMEMMGEPPAKPDNKPCDGLTLDCIFAMGCAMPLMRDPVAPPTSTTIVVPQLFWPSTAELSGTDSAPETHPPTNLG